MNTLVRLLPLWLATGLTCLAQPLPTSAEAKPLNIPPAGFTWQELPEIRGRCLKPVGWSFTKGKTLREGWSAYFITKHKLNGHGEQLTGLTIEPRQNIYARHGQAPSLYAKQLSAEAAKNFGLLTSFSLPADKKANQGFALEGFVYRYKAPDGSARIVQTVCFSFDPSDLFYLTTFEAPESDGKEAAQTAELLQKTLQLQTDL
jgi:hypothetical protein